MNGRADVYVGFIQAGLEALLPGGVLAFICADRWMRNQYGKRLRSLVEEQFAIDAVITLHDSDAFEERVAAYPAVFAVRAGEQGPALVVDADSSFGEAGAQEVGLSHSMGRVDPSVPVLAGHGFTAAWTPGWFVGAESWPAGRPDRVALVAALESRLPTLAAPEVGVRLGIGIASGADRVYLTKDTETVESERLLPLAMSGDLQHGKVVWSGTHLINPWDDDGLIDLANYPRASQYLSANEERLRARHVGKRQPDRWYRTIDRPIAHLAQEPKLLVPDLRHRLMPVLESEGLYPHHNLIWMTSAHWDLRVLGGLLMSDFGTMFVETYSPRMAGGALRVTAQYLRRIRVPAPETIATRVQEALAAAFDAQDVSAATTAAAAAYGVEVSAISV